MRINNLSKVDVNLEIKLSKWHNKLSQKEQLELSEITRLLVQSSQERESNDALCLFVNISLTNKEIQRTCLYNKCSTSQNTPKPKPTYDSNLCVISAVKTVRNSLLLGFDTASTRGKHYDVDIENALITPHLMARKYKKN